MPEIRQFWAKFNIDWLCPRPFIFDNTATKEFGRNFGIGDMIALRVMHWAPNRDAQVHSENVSFEKTT